MNSAILLLLILTTFVDIVVGECCAVRSKFYESHGKAIDYCADNTEGWATPDGHRCCGLGRCNNFCCSCEDGCRKAPTTNRRKRQVYPQRNFLGYVDTFSRMDTDQNGLVSMQEAQMYMMSGAMGSPLAKMHLMPFEFNRMDVNRDGFLNRWEIGAL